MHTLRRQQGAETVEFMITLLLFFAVFLMIIEFAIVTYDRGTINNAVREGSRQASLYWVAGAASNVWDIDVAPDGSLYLADTNVYVPRYGRLNSARIEDAHALDLRIDRRWSWGRVKMSAYLDVTNVYAHARVLGYTYNFDYSQREAITELPIVPTLGLRGAL